MQTETETEAEPVVEIVRDTIYVSLDPEEFTEKKIVVKHYGKTYQITGNEMGGLNIEVYPTDYGEPVKVNVKSHDVWVVSESDYQSLIKIDPEYAALFPAAPPEIQ